MRQKIAIIAAISILAVLGTAYGEEGKISGEVSLVGAVRDATGDVGKFNEYKDVQSGLYGSTDLRYQKGGYHVDFEARDVGYKTQRYHLEGGRWSAFRYDLQYDEIPHNLTRDARTFYSGVGSSNLTYPTHPPSTNPDTWSTFDYGVKRKNMDGSFKLDLLQPFYLDVSANQQKKMGVYPLGAAGTSPGGIALELPINLDYTTNNFKVATGYSTKPLFFSVSYLFSKFDNGEGVQNFRNPATVNTAATADTVFLSPNNDYRKLGVQGGVQLPWKSRLSADVSQARATSSASLATSYVSNLTAATSNIGAQGRTGIGLSSPDFNGKVNTDNYNFALTSNPVSFLNAKLFYKYYNKLNTSDRITTTDQTQNPQFLVNQLFDYRKDLYGLELGFKLPASFFLSTAYNYTTTDRRRDDLPKNRDNLYDVGLKWSGLDLMTVKVGYERLDRAADFTATATGISPLEPFLRRFDGAPRERDTYRTSLEFFPLESLNFNLGYKHKNTKYTDTTLGLTDAKADQVDFNVEWQAHKRLKLSGYFDFEQRVLNQFQRQTDGTVANLDPASAPTAANFNWTSEQTESTFGYGLGADLSVIPGKLNLQLGHNYVKSDGTVDLTYLLGTLPLPVGRTQDNIDLNARDNYRLNNFVVKAIYQWTKAVSLTAAYAFEEFSYEDSQYSGYQFFVNVTQGGFLTGAYKDPSYRTHVGMIGVNIKF